MKNIKVPTIDHKGTRMVKDGEDYKLEKFSLILSRRANREVGPLVATSFPGSLFSASLRREAEKRDRGNEVALVADFPA